MKKYLLILLLALSVKASCIPPPNTYDWEAQRWQTQVIAAGSSLSSTAYRAGTVFMQQSKWWDIRSSLGRVNLYVGADLTAMAVPIIRDWWTTVDGVDTFPSFVAGDFSETSGLTGNGTTKYLVMAGGGGGSVSLNGNTTATSIHLAVYVRTGTNESSYCIGTQDGSSPFAPWHIAVSYANTSYGNMGNGAASMNFPDTNGVGFYMVTRRSTTDSALYKNGIFMTNDTTLNTTILVGNPVTVHTLDQPAVGLPGFPTSRTLSYYAAGFKIADSLAKPYNDMVQNAQIPFNRQK